MYVGDTPENVVTTDKLFIGHYPDRSKDRSFYLNLLEDAVKDNPNDDRNMHYLGREYMYVGEWNKSIDTLIKHVYLDSSTWDEEKSASIRFISRDYLALNRFDEAEMWLQKSLELTPYLREPYVEMGLLHYYRKDYKKAIRYLLLSLKITEKSPTYINEDFAWNETPYDVLGLCYFYLGDKSNALKYTEIAFNMNSSNDRLKNNYDFIKRS
ncbi:MAG: tetratricopeptide repeat protein [Bacilli bacterium]|nr:tetratricopeptide repeat protein [Bacilli bacterium]